MRKGLAAATLVVLLFGTPLASFLESGMRLQMFVLYPLLALCGWLLGQGMPHSARVWFSGWNAWGLSGLATGTLFLAVLMIPRVIDEGMNDHRVEILKVAMLLAVGAVMQPSWRVAGLVLQTFFLGAMLPMMAVVGSLYRDSSWRLCNAYRLDDQQRLGSEMMWLSAALGALWLLGVVRRCCADALRDGAAVTDR